jgi:hypothetical protein
VAEASEHKAEPPVDPKRQRRAALLTSGAGIGYGLLSIAGWLLLSGARDGLADGSDLRDIYSGGGVVGPEIAGLFLLPFAAILFLWFIVALRGWIRNTQQRRNLLISDVQLVSGTVFTAVFLVGAAAIATSVVVAQAGPGELTPQSLRALAGFGNTLMVVMGVRIAAIFVIATASLGTTTSVLPHWFNIVSYGFGLVLMLTPIVEQALSLAFPVWVIALSILLLYHLMNLRDDELPGFARRYRASGTAATGDISSD